MPYRRWWIALIAAAGCGGAKVKKPAKAVTPCPAPTAQIEKLVADLDVAPDPTHADYTPSVHALIDLGHAGACGVVARLEADDADSRLHAQRVVEGVVDAENGFRPGRGYPHQYAEERARETVVAIGYDAGAAEPARRAAAARWRAWIEGSHAPAPTPEDGPTPQAMRTALDEIRDQLEKCGQPLDVTVTFESSGRPSTIVGHASKAVLYQDCLRASVSGARVPQMPRGSTWIRYPAW
jgi:hypothetical protein